MLPRPVLSSQLYREAPVQLVMQGDYVRTGEQETVAATMAITRTVIEQPGEQTTLDELGIRVNSRRH